MLNDDHAPEHHRSEGGYRLALATLGAASAVGVCAAEAADDPVLPAALGAAVVIAALLSLSARRTARVGLLPHWLVTLASVGAFAAAVYEIGQWGVPTVRGLGHFFMAVIILKFLDRDSARDNSELLITSLFLVVIGAIVSGQLLYAVTLLVYLLVGLWALVAYHRKSELERISLLASPRRAPSPAPQSPAVFTALHAGGAAAVPLGLTWRGPAIALACGVLVFVLCPRFGTAALLSQATMPLAMSMTGFSDSVRFGGVSQITKSQRVVMRVELYVNGEALGSANLQPYFRGSTCSVYDGRHWIPNDDSRARRRTVRDEPLLDGYRPGPRDRVLEQRIRLTSPSRYLFACYAPFHVSLESDQPATFRPTDRTLTIPAQRRSESLDYTVVSLTRVTPELARAMRRQIDALPDDDVPRVFRRPRLRPEEVVAPRVRDYVRDLVADLPPPVDGDSIRAVARRIESHFLEGGFSYTLDRSDVNPQREAIEDLLFHRRRGHCEYYASAMTVMCQLAGLDARLVSGYRGGEWNATGGYYIVTEQDAHTWVEVYTPDADWVAFDPTPRSVDERPDSDSIWQTVRSMASHAQMLWADRVVAYSATNREALMAHFANWLSKLGQHKNLAQEVLYAARELLLGPEALAWGYRVMYWFVILLSLFAAYMGARLAARPARAWGRWAVRTAWPRKRRPRQEAFYAQALDALADLGFTKSPHSTPLEHMQQVASTAARFAVVPQVAIAYYQVHFGRRPLSREQRRRIGRILANLRLPPDRSNEPPQAPGPD